ncbi:MULTISPECIES: response regulator [unclassified Neisseria]|uniref:response regulator n=1 Tax=unclassified Neisseria TaxID=2623750 RepID=UPI0026654AF2|nr:MULTISPECIES: response regulator [unclassified Neisseria]MDO1510049.1 response regulator [Neisseria sp. MVDL19-042950]MDO1516921.1 response regulator [Neisseria sp. MVDL18-041461]MDO1564206.1 response regulator [Neisseria sp. MVDL20-010259]
MLTVMVVDDSNVIRKRITRGSESMEFEVVATAANGKDAVQLYDVLRPNLVTMDLTMPEMDGLACIQKIMDIDENANILVISALADKATGIKALEYGARGFLYKPFTDDDLFEALKEMSEGL